MPSVLHTFINGKSERYIVASFVLKTGVTKSIVDLHEIPILIAHTKYVTVGKLCDIVIILLSTEILINDSLCVLFI